MAFSRISLVSAFALAVAACVSVRNEVKPDKVAPASQPQSAAPIPPSELLLRAVSGFKSCKTEQDGAACVMLQSACGNIDKAIADYRHGIRSGNLFVSGGGLAEDAVVEAFYIACLQAKCDDASREMFGRNFMAGGKAGYLYYGRAANAMNSFVDLSYLCQP